MLWAIDKQKASQSTSKQRFIRGAAGDTSLDEPKTGLSDEIVWPREVVDRQERRGEELEDPSRRLTQDRGVKPS